MKKKQLGLRVSETLNRKNNRRSEKKWKSVRTIIFILAIQAKDQKRDMGKIVSVVCRNFGTKEGSDQMSSQEMRLICG